MTSRITAIDPFLSRLTQHPTDSFDPALPRSKRQTEVVGHKIKCGPSADVASAAPLPVTSESCPDSPAHVGRFRPPVRQTALSKPKPPRHRLAVRRCRAHPP